MTWANFYATVAAFANRTNADLIVNGQDLVITCANMAKTEAQRRHNFKMARTVGFITPNSTPGGPTSSVNTEPDGSGLNLNVKRLEAAWLWSNDSGGNPARSRYVPVVTVGDLKIFYPSVNSFGINIKNAPQSIPTSQTYVYMQGTNLYILGTTIPNSIWLDVIPLLADYDGTVTDFFLNFHYDWLILKTLDYLNLFLKEDQRVQISTAKMEAAWQNVTAFDEDFQDSSNDEDALN